ncbi:hypothetical protein [Brevibacillus laterosporus]|nr:hypothetical protein [Brevibacillus laterosporus]
MIVRNIKYSGHWHVVVIGKAKEIREFARQNMKDLKEAESWK